VKRLLLLVGACFALQTVNVALGQELRIGFVDSERVFKEAAPAVKAMKKLEKEFQPRQEEIKQIDEQARALQVQLEREGMTMSATQRRERESELGRLAREKQRLEREGVVFVNGKIDLDRHGYKGALDHLLWNAPP